MSLTALSRSRAFLRDGAYVTDPVLTDRAATYTPGVSERRGAATTFLHSGLKNADAQSGTTQTVAATRQSDAFGNLASSTGTWNGPFGYAGGFGYQEDATGLKLLGHRYYDSSTGRFLTRDPIKDGRNWYAYCDNDPLSRIDPTGLWSLYRWLYTGDGDAPDEVYNNALDQAWKTLTVWAKHFAIDNGIAAPPTAVVIGPYPKALVPKAVFRVATQEGSSPFTSGVRVAAQKLPALRPAAQFVKGNQPLIWLYTEVAIAWTATYQTMTDPDVWIDIE